MKKILVLTENFPPIEGGSSRWFWELYSRLSPETIIVVTQDSTVGIDFDRSQQMNIERMSLSCTEWGFRSVKGLMFYWRCFWQIRRLVKKHNIEEIHCGRVIHEGVTAWLLKTFLGIPYICYVHGEDVETAATSREQSLLVKQVCKNSRYLICNSNNTANLVSSLGFSSIEHCRILHPGVDLKKFTPAPSNNEFRKSMQWKDKVVLLTVGRLQRRKGQDFMIKAMAELVKIYPSLLYSIVGQGECFEELSGLVTDLKLENHVQIHTNLGDKDLINCYQQCDLFILPNRTIGNDIEGFGMVLVEAQACGKGVVAGSSGGTSETMERDVTGKIIDCNSVTSIIDGVSTILDSEDYKAWQRAANDHATKKFGWDAHVSAAVSLFNS